MSDKLKVPGFNPKKEFSIGHTKFKTGGRLDYWKDVPDSQWNSWIWQQQNRIRRMDVLEKAINVSPEESAAFVESSKKFNMAITPYYASLMDPNDQNCPIRLQSVPQPGELEVRPEDLEDPLGEEKDMPVPGITHRYPDRVLFYTTHHCPVYCRHCTRKRKVADPSSATMKKQLEAGLEYIRKTPSIRDVVLSGGDPLSLSDTKLDYIMGSLRKIPHIEVFRLGTRNLVTLPHRITDDFVKMLAKHRPFFVHTHFNHWKEINTETFEACDKLSRAGIPLNNQMVLLKGVNDDAETVMKTNHLMLMMGVRPYYIYQCDLAEGISHFRTPIDTGIKIIEKLRGHTSGMAVPTYVVDAPGGGGKIPLQPNYIVDDSKPGQTTFRNYKFDEYTYTEPQE